MKLKIILFIASICFFTGCEPDNLTPGNKALVITGNEFMANGLVIPGFSVDNEIIGKVVNYDQTYSINYEYANENSLLIKQSVIVDKSGFTADLLHDMARELTLKTIEEKGCKIENCNYKFEYENTMAVYDITDQNGIQIGTFMEIEYELVKYSLLMIGINMESQEKIDQLFKEKMKLYEDLNKKKKGFFG